MILAPDLENALSFVWGKVCMGQRTNQVENRIGVKAGFEKNVQRGSGTVEGGHYFGAKERPRREKNRRQNFRSVEKERDATSAEELHSGPSPLEQRILPVDF